MPAGERLSEALDRLRQVRNLLVQPPGVGLLGGELAADRRELVLHHLQLIDRFLLGLLQPLGLFDELLLRGLRGACLQCSGHGCSVSFGRCTGIDAPDRGRGGASEDEAEGRRGERDRLGAYASAVIGGTDVVGDWDHQLSKVQTNVSDAADGRRFVSRQTQRELT